MPINPRSWIIRTGDWHFRPFTLKSDTLTLCDAAHGTFDCWVIFLLMFNANKILIDRFVIHTRDSFELLFVSPDPMQLLTLEQAVRTALHTLLNCDCPYHDMQHTLLVADVGQTILRGRQLAEGDLDSHDWLHAMVAMLFHDIGYIRNLLQEDTEESSVVDAEGARVSLPEGASDASITPYHVTRGVLFVQQYFAADSSIDARRVGAYIEMTRFPVPPEPTYQQTASLAGLVRAADLIGQMADPQYRQKLSRLYAEFVETGEARRLGVTSPGDLHDSFPAFFSSQVQPYIGTAVEYLQYTREGQGWLENLDQRLGAPRVGNVDSGPAALETDRHR